jgi:uncharacterized protein YcfL
MKYTLSIVALALLTGCSTTAVPVRQKFPEAPEIIYERCLPLRKLDNEKSSLSEIARTVSENYTAYYECSVKVDAWRAWYRDQKKIFEEVK